MRVLLDTHALLCFFAGDNQLSQPAKTIIGKEVGALQHYEISDLRGDACKVCFKTW